MGKFTGEFQTANVGKVIKMDRFRGGARLSPIRQAEAYWSALRDGPGIPRRTQIDPRGLENLLEYAFILERVAPGIARFRLAGQHLSLLSGMEVRGMPLSALYTPASRATLCAALEHVFDSPAVAELTMTSEPRYGRPMIEAHMILLPLKSDFGDISRALGVIVSDCGTVAAPNRFDVTSTAFRPVSGLQYMPAEEVGERVQTPSLPAAATELPSSGGFAEPSVNFARPKATQRARKPHLRLVKSD